MVSEFDRPFADLPAALVDDLLQHTEDLSKKLLSDFEHIRSNRSNWRDQFINSNLLRRDAELPFITAPTTCGTDGSYAIERLLASDFIVVASVAVEGLVPPSETRFWDGPKHLTIIETEIHGEETSSILRALMIGMELVLAVRAPHDVVFIDGSLTTPLIYFNQGLNKLSPSPKLMVSHKLIEGISHFLRAYHSILEASRSDHIWVGVPKYTTKREIGQSLGWPDKLDDRGLLTLILEPGEFSQPQPLQSPDEPWHLNVNHLPIESRDSVSELANQITMLLDSIQVLYYRPFSWLPALRLETSRSVTENSARLSTLLQGIKHQCGNPSMLEPYPLYLADRFVKQLPRAIPTFRQVASQRLSETYSGDLGDIFMGLHGYRTEGK